MTHCWLSSPTALSQIQALCLGTGRFLRSVLVPALVGAGMEVGLIQTRGRSMMEYMAAAGDSTYEVDTVQTDGTIETSRVPCRAVFSLGNEADKHALAEALSEMTQGISILGVGVTEAGLASKDTQVMKDLYELLHLICHLQHDQTWPTQTVCVIDMDNVPNNGSLIQSYMMEFAKDSEESSLMHAFLTNQVVFCDTMVDRITSQRPHSGGMVPRCEPSPAKALVICDPQGKVPVALAQQPGVICRSTSQQLDLDIALKLRIANGTHTAIAHMLALLRHLMTDKLSEHQANNVFMRYLDTLVEEQVYAGMTGSVDSLKEAKAVWADWRQRLIHPHFGLSSFFITQNGTAKGGIRWGPTVVDMIQKSNVAPQVSLALAYAVLLRWLTPVSLSDPMNGGVYRGWLDGVDPAQVQLAATSDTESSSSTQVYADGLRYDLEQGWYEFKCPLTDLAAQLEKCLATKAQPQDCHTVIQNYLTNELGGNLSAISDTPRFQELLQGIAVLYARLLAGDSLSALLDELDRSKHGIGFSSPCSSLTCSSSAVSRFAPLHFQPTTIPDTSRLLQLPVTMASLESTVISEVQSVVAIDLHTHLLPPTHGPLCLWGIDELLTYHYLVAEYFITAPAAMTPAAFYSKSKQDQADLIWEALFLRRSPISEACRGVLTTLCSLGLQDAVKRRDLEAIRKFYQQYRDQANGAHEFCQAAFTKSGIDYAIMTNIPFDSNEARYWRPYRTEYSQHFRSALRVDPLLAGDRLTIESTLKASGYDVTLEGARQYLRDWVDIMQPEYMMASTPHDFVVREGSLGNARNLGVNTEAMKQPGAFAAAQAVTSCDGPDDEAPSVIDEHSDFLSDVLMKVCEERDLPVALKIGAHRAVNPSLRAAGDGVVAFADAGMLSRLCTRFPKVRFLATFLSRNNQHEACVLASKFRNLHLYGCWWFCNNPSIIREMTTMRLEMLGTAFTAQHSDARVVDQLLYKWPHSRAVIAQVLVEEYSKSLQSGWAPARAEIRRDVYRLFRGSYEEFMAKSLQ